jgi:ABC-type amino acid transport substrate-binding protein
MQIGTPERGDFRGYEVDILEEIGRRNGWLITFKPALWSVIIRELMADEIDLVCSAATVTAERERDVDFCIPHLRLALAIVKREGLPNDTAITGLRIGVRRGTVAEEYARSHGIPEPAQILESNALLYSALAVGTLDAVIDDSPIAKYYSLAVKGIQFSGILPGTEADYAIMIRKGNTKLRTEINSALDDMENDGTLHALRLTWFGDGSRDVNR